MKKPKRLSLSLIVSLFLLALFVQVSTALDAQAPTATLVTPVNNSVLSMTDFGVEITLADLDDNIQSNNYFIKLDGVEIPSEFYYKGHWVYDYDEDPGTWIVDSYRNAILYSQVSAAKDGPHTIEVKATDVSGHIVNQTWNFTVAVKPRFSDLTPFNQTVTNVNSGFSVKVTDNSLVNPQSIKSELDNTAVNVSFDPVTGIVAYKNTIPDGSHKVKVTAADAAGNSDTKEWTFTVQTKGPDLTFAGSGQTYKTSQVTLAIDVKSNARIQDTGTIMKVDGQQVVAQFYYKGHWITDYDDVESYIIDSYNQGRISFTTPSLSDGPHEVTVSSTDVLGSNSNQTWSFNVAQPPVFANIEPLNGAIIANKPVVRAEISDPNGNLDPNNISLLVDNIKVTPTIVNYDGRITLTYSSNDLSNDSYHDVILTATDLKNNIASSTWRFFACAIGQATGFSRQSPGIGSEVTELPLISVHFTDLNKLYNASNITISIDGSTPVRPTVQGKDTEFFITYTPQALNDGNHSVTVKAPSLTVGGTPLSSTWNFVAKIPPVITKTSPTYTVTNSLPLLSAYATDNTGVASANFMVDGKTLVGTIDPKFNRISAQVTSALAPGSHDVSLTVLDTSGYHASANWKFDVDTNIGPQFPEMTVATNATCWQCHQKEYNTGHVVPSQCAPGCHTPKVIESLQFKDCLGCHYGTTYNTQRHAWDTEWAWTWTNLPNRRHAITDNHLSTSDGCSECHSRILTIEHNRPDRTDEKGNPITCDTCHTGSNLSAEEATRVKEAISQKNTSCDSCHVQGGHLSIHNSGMEAKCTQSGCHNGNLQTEHIGNMTTAGKEYTCNTCHDSTRNEVTRAIRNNQLSCSSCHTTAHTLPLTESIPADIPFYQGLAYTKPIEASIFTRDQGLPTGFESNYKTGLVVLSSRADLNVANVWSFYKTQLVDKGWVLKSPEPAVNPSYFSAEFTKYGRLLTVRCYNTSFGDNNGPLCSGYRVDIWYK